EGCDDGNLANNDGCSSACQVEAPYTCMGNTPSVCKSTNEINCNDGVDNDGDGQIDCADADCALACDAVNFGTCAAGEALLEYTSTDVPKAIPDNNAAGINSNIVVGGLGLVSRTVMQMSITHTYDADLDITLKSPGAIATDVTSDNGLGGDNYTNT